MKPSCIFLPLGGTGEIGMNCNLYGATNKRGDYEWIMVDLGVTFAKGELGTAGIDVIMPDLQFIEEAGGLQALLLTHGHEDHIGAVAHMWERLQCPIYATPFTAHLLRGKLDEYGMDDVPLNIIDINAHLEIGAFSIDYITLTHSIAEPCALAIRAVPHKSDAVNILHTGDWKIDPDPVIGELTQEARLKEFGDAGIDAIICDSTNALVEGRSGSEGVVAKNMIETIAACKRRVVVTSFASNVARVASVCKAAAANGRQVCLAGRGMHRIVAAAQANGYLCDLPPFVEEEAAQNLPPEELLILCTGSQGESQAALARLARGSHPNLKLQAGDSVLFSSRVIPGNEVEINLLKNKLIKKQINIITPNGNDLHVSGHPCRDELRDMYAWARPRIAIPVHGEAQHLKSHAELARELGVGTAVEISNGDIVQLSKTKTNAPIVNKVNAGRLYLDGRVLISSDDETLEKRNKISQNGLVVICVPLNSAKNLSGEIDISLFGIPEVGEGEEDEFFEAIAQVAERVIPAKGKVQHNSARNKIRQQVRQAMRHSWGKNPQVEVRFINCA